MISAWRSDLVQTTLRWGAIILTIILCLWHSGLIFANYVVWSKFANDFGVYWRTANLPVSHAYFWQGSFPFPYAPTMLLWISPLALIPKWAAYFAFIAVSATAFVMTVRPYLSKGAIALVVVSPPFLRGIFTGQVCAALSAMLIWACGTRNRSAAGVALGIIASIKPQLVLMAPLMLVLNRDWRAFNAAAFSFGAIVLLSLILFGPERWPEWLASMGHFHRAVADTTVIEIGVTPATIAERFGYPPLPFMLLGTAVGVGVVYLCRDLPPLEKATAIVLGSLLAAPYALAYDLLPLLPLLALSVRRGNLLAAPAMAAMFNPLPLFVAFLTLGRWRWPAFRAKGLA